jgi:hypothetical protein
MNYIDICPPAVVIEIDAADLRSSSAGRLITWVEENSDRQCAVAALEAVAGRLSPESDLQVVEMFCNAVASYARMLDDEQKAILKAGYRRITYNSAISFNYFAGLRKAGIDMGSGLPRIRPDWSFATPRRDAETWDYFMYLASLGHSDALTALQRKIDATTKGNDAWLLLQSLADLPGPEVTAILRAHADDARQTDGVEGPGLPILTKIKVLLNRR